MEYTINTPEGPMPVISAHNRIWFDGAAWGWSDCSDPLDGAPLSGLVDGPHDCDDEAQCDGYWCPPLMLVRADGDAVWTGRLSMDR